MGPKGADRNGMVQGQIEVPILPGRRRLLLLPDQPILPMWGISTATAPINRKQSRCLQNTAIKLILRVVLH